MTLSPPRPLLPGAERRLNAAVPAPERPPPRGDELTSPTVIRLSPSWRAIAVMLLAAAAPVAARATEGALPSEFQIVDAGQVSIATPVAGVRHEVRPLPTHRPVTLRGSKGSHAQSSDFEPERAMRGTWQEREHSPGLLQPSAAPDALRYAKAGSAAGRDAAWTPPHPPRESGGTGQPAQAPHGAGRVRLNDHALVDDQGAFLGLGASYFTALWRYRHDRARWESDLAFLARQGFRYTRVLSMVGWFPAWQGLEIAPVSFTNRAGHAVAPWPDYWQALAGLVDLSHDRYGLRTQITIFADAQLMPSRAERVAHLRRLLAEVVAGREHKIMLLEVANEAWQNGFPGAAGVADLRQFTRYLADRTEVLVATTSNHEDSFEALYRDSAADIATWHFSRDRAADDGWRPVMDCRRLARVPGCPPVSSNEPIGPGASVASESDPAKLVLAAAYAFASRLPMYVFHSEAGVFGRTRFEDTPSIREFRHLARLLPGDLANWTSVEAGERDAPLSADGCVSMVCCQRGERMVGVPVGVRREGLALTARAPLRLRAFDLLTGQELGVTELVAGKRTELNLKSAAVVLMN